MYVFPSMLKLTKIIQPTDTHQKVAENVLLCNPRYTNLTALIDGARIISEIPNDKIKKVTAEDLFTLGIKMP